MKSTFLSRRNRTLILVIGFTVFLLYLNFAEDFKTNVTLDGASVNSVAPFQRSSFYLQPASQGRADFVLETDETELSERRKDVTVAGLRRRLPNCIIVGAAKCGTEAVQYFLQLHPDIATDAALTELNFFSKDNLYKLGYDWFRAKMPLSLSNQTRVHRGTWCWDTLGVPYRIFSMNPDVKLIVLVCEPVRRAISWYTHYLVHSRNTTIRSFNDEFFSSADGRVNPSQRAIRSARYLENMQRWMNVFRRDQIHVISGEDFRKDPYPELVKVEKFLGLKPRISKSNIVYSETKKFYCKFLNGREVCLTGSKGRQHVEVAPDRVDKLKQYFKPYNADFSKFSSKIFDWD